jgi:hypothetical protein
VFLGFVLINLAFHFWIGNKTFVLDSSSNITQPGGLQNINWIYTYKAKQFFSSVVVVLSFCFLVPVIYMFAAQIKNKFYKSHHKKKRVIFNLDENKELLLTKEGDKQLEL